MGRKQAMLSVIIFLTGKSERWTENGSQDKMTMMLQFKTLLGLYITGL